MSGKIWIVFNARESLLLSSGDDLSVAHQTGRTIVVERGNAEDVSGHKELDKMGYSSDTKKFS